MKSWKKSACQRKNEKETKGNDERKRKKMKRMKKDQKKDESENHLRCCE
jgi:hypothetical protein